MSAQPSGIAGREVGAAFREVIARRMTPAQIGEAQRTRPRVEAKLVWYSSLSREGTALRIIHSKDHE